ncbi:MAG: DUF480 domain-containing protein [Planctomycetes bacterium]|nr:DUF480 domain-containing protein [Planctomycetota bacterium]
MSVPHLNPHEARVLGVLIEKALTVPDQYPLSLHAATTGSNQKNNRWPVVEYSEAEVHIAFQGLLAKHLAHRSVAAGSRVDKYKHGAQDALGLDDAHAAILAELLMRGPQQPGELRSRVERMTPGLGAELLMERIARLREKGLVQRIDPLPGERAERYLQTLCPQAHPLDAVAPVVVRPIAAPRLDLEARVLALENEVAILRRSLEHVLSELGAGPLPPA